MGRSRRQSSAAGRGASKRVPKDYVYNTETYAVTYALEATPEFAQALPLTYAQNTVRQITQGLPGVEPNWIGVFEVQSGAATPTLSKQRVYGVQGWMRVSPTTWNVGSEYNLIFRLLHGEQDTENAALIIGTGYSGIINTLDMDAAQCANAGFLKEWRMAELVTNTVGVVTRGQWMVPINWRSRKGIQLGNDRALFMYMESGAGSVDLRITPYLRTLMKAPQA